MEPTSFFNLKKYFSLRRGGWGGSFKTKRQRQGTKAQLENLIDFFDLRSPRFLDENVSIQKDFFFAEVVSK